MRFVVGHVVFSRTATLVSSQDVSIANVKSDLGSEMGRIGRRGRRRPWRAGGRMRISHARKHTGTVSCDWEHQMEKCMKQRGHGRSSPRKCIASRDGDDGKGGTPSSLGHHMLATHAPRVTRLATHSRTPTPSQHPTRRPRP